MKNYLQIIGLPETATIEEIRKTCVKLFKEFHPDKLRGGTPESNQRFIDIYEACEFLLNPAKNSKTNGAVDSTTIKILDLFALMFLVYASYRAATNLYAFTRSTQRPNASLQDLAKAQAQAQAQAQAKLADSSAKPEDKLKKYMGRRNKI